MDHLCVLKFVTLDYGICGTPCLSLLHVYTISMHGPDHFVLKSNQLFLTDRWMLAGWKRR